MFEVNYLDSRSLLHKLINLEFVSCSLSIVLKGGQKCWNSHCPNIKKTAGCVSDHDLMSSESRYIFFLRIETFVHWGPPWCYITLKLHMV